MGRVESADLVFPLGQDLLYIAQMLLGAGNERRVGELVDHLPVFLLSAIHVDRVAVRLFHLHVVDVGNAHLRLCGHQAHWGRR